MKKKKNSAMKKLIPATSMLLVSATMLTASTYAWFTMSREVEVTGIKMTATVPEDIQISLGDNTERIVSGASSNVGLAVTANLTDNGKVPYDAIKAPDGAINGAQETQTVKNTTDWYNTVDFSRHYVAGKLRPVSSTDGNYLFKTSDANEEGKAVERTASFTSVTRADEAGLYRIGSVASDNYTYNSTDTSYLNSENLAEGYYVDFPVWFRTSAKASTSVNHTTGYVTSSNLNLGVVASITQRTATDAEQDLHHAVRVAILPSGNDNSTDGTMVNTGSTGTIVNTVQGAQDTAVNWYNRYSSTASGNDKTSDTALDSVTRQAVKAPGNLIWNPSNANVTNASSLYGWADLVKQAYTAEVGESVAIVPLAAANKDWGYSQRYIIRVWLEGEDVNCWNETAGQDWDISLKFVKLESTESSGSDTSATSHAAPADNAGGLGATSTDSAATAVTENATVSLTLKKGDDTIATFSYTYDSTNGYTVSTTATSTWKGTATIGNAIDKANWSLADGTTFANETDFVNYLNKYNGKYDLAAIVLTSTDYVAP